MKYNLLELKKKLEDECESYVNHLMLDIIRQNPKSKYTGEPFFKGITEECYLLRSRDIESMMQHTFRNFDDSSKRVNMAKSKLAIVCTLIKELPKAPTSSKDFDNFSLDFQDSRRELEQMRRNDTVVDKFLIPFLKAVAGLLSCLTIILAPLAYYGLYKTTGSNTADKLNNLLHKVYDEPSDIKSNKP